MICLIKENTERKWWCLNPLWSLKLVNKWCAQEDLRNGCGSYTCGSMLKYSFPVTVTHLSVCTSYMRVCVFVSKGCTWNEKDVWKKSCCCLRVDAYVRREKKRIWDLFSFTLMINSNILKTPFISGQQSGEKVKALPAFHPLPSFISAILIMVLRLVLDVLTKLLIWRKGKAQRHLFERITAGKNEKREFSMWMFKRWKGS